MIRRHMLITTLLVAGTIAGCIPEKRVHWSPDGRHAAVLAGNEGLYLCDPQGKLSERLAEGVRRVDWCSDSQRLLVVQQRDVNNWSDVASTLSPDYVAALEEIGRRLHADILAHTGDIEKLKSPWLDHPTDAEKAALLLFLRDEQNQGMPEKLGEKWAELADATATLHTLRVARVDQQTFRFERTLTQSLDDISPVRVSPTDRHVAFGGVCPLHELLDQHPLPAAQDRNWLFVQAVAGDEGPRVVNRTMTTSIDWSPHGRQVVYTAANGELGGGQNLHLGVLERCEVADDAGKLLRKFPDADSLAGILFSADEKARVRYLSDGRILFASVELHLPCTAADMPQQASLFVIDPQRYPVVLRVVPEAAQMNLPDGVFLFEVSPDDRHVCIPGSNGEIALLDLVEGGVWHVLGDEKAGGFATVPDWRSANELCFAVPREEDESRLEMVLSRLVFGERETNQRALSADWPPAVVNDFLQKGPGDEEEEKEAGNKGG